jgi:hypothetical protein
MRGLDIISVWYSEKFQLSIYKLWRIWNIDDNTLKWKLPEISKIRFKESRPRHILPNPGPGSVLGNISISRLIPAPADSTWSRPRLNFVPGRCLFSTPANESMNSVTAYRELEYMYLPFSNMLVCAKLCLVSQPVSPISSVRSRRQSFSFAIMKYKGVVRRQYDSCNNGPDYV